MNFGLYFISRNFSPRLKHLSHSNICPFSKMRILYIYRNPAQGFSITKVFKTLEEELQSQIEIDCLYLPGTGAGIGDLLQNVKAVLKAIKETRYDLVHITGGDHYLGYFIRKRQPVVITVHDIGFYVNHKPSIRIFLKYILWIRSLRYASYLTFISSKTQQEVSKKIDLSKIPHEVITNPVDPFFQKTPRIRDVHAAVRLLHIGTGPNKNLENTIFALRGSDKYELRIVGKLSLQQEALLKESHTRYSNVYNLSDEEIRQEYIQCDLVNFPSFYEGFGMPIIEGQAIGRPVVTSSLSPMKEVAGRGAILVDPYNPESIKEGYREAMQRYDYWVLAGLKNMERFNVRTISSLYLNLYKRLTNE